VLQVLIVFLCVGSEEFRLDFPACVGSDTLLNFIRTFRIIGILRKEAAQGVHNVNAVEPAVIVDDLHFAFSLQLEGANKDLKSFGCHKPKVMVIDTDCQGLGKPRLYYGFPCGRIHRPIV